MACYTYGQLEGFAVKGGFPASLAPTMAAIAMAESSGCDQIQPGQPYATTGWGLWQITPGNSVPRFGVDNQLLDPVANARAAYSKFVGAGGLSNPEVALSNQWTTYSSGAWRTNFRPGVPIVIPGGAEGSTGSGNGSNPLPSPGDIPGAIGSIPGKIGDLPGTIIGGPLNAIKDAAVGKVMDVVKGIAPYIILLVLFLIVAFFLLNEFKSKAMGVPEQ